jgi:mono/diheme cytochrome c family protein
MYCLTCHHIRGVGGKKYPPDLLQASCQWKNTDLKTLIEAPSRFKTNSTMPPLGRMLPENERKLIIERIVNYLRVMQIKQGLSCIKWEKTYQ